MILVVGGTGFIGQILVRQLIDMGKSVRLLIKPSKDSPKLLKGVPVDVAVTSLRDERGLRAAFRDVSLVFHLVSDERQGSKANLTGVDVEGTIALVRTAKQANVKRMIYLSHLGADQGSAFAVLRTKSISETQILKSRVPYTIFRTAIVYGPGDQFTTSIARLLKYSPGFVLIPGDGSTLIQPIWVEDLIACMITAMDDPNMADQVFAVGGGEYFTLRQAIEKVMNVTGRKRILVSLAPAYLRTLALILEQFIPRLPISTHWLDYVGSDRTCSLDTLPRIFDIIPARFTQQLNYLRGQ